MLQQLSQRMSNADWSFQMNRLAARSSATESTLRGAFPEELKIIGVRNRNIEIVGVGPELMQREGLRLRMDAMNAVFGDDAVIISDVEADHCMIHAVARTDSGNDDSIPARLQLELFQHRLHRGFVKAVVRCFLHHILARKRPQFPDEVRAGAAKQQAVGASKDSEFRMILGTDRLNMNDLSIQCAEAIQQAPSIGNDRFYTRSMSFTSFHLHIDNNETCRLWVQFDFGIGHR